MIEILILITSLVVLIFSSEKAVNYILKISKLFKLSGMAAGFIIMSVSTSLPEVVVSIISALKGESQIAVGNVLGSNIANMTIILGLAVLISRKRNLKFRKSVFDNLIRFLFISSIIPLFIFQSGGVTYLLGIILLILFVFFSVKTPTKVSVKEITTMRKRDKTVIILKFIAAISLVVISSDFLVDSAAKLAINLGIPSSVIGATIIALGTSLPELATSTQAFRKRLYDIGLGDVIGSCITNLTLVLGTTSLINPIKLNLISFTSLILFAIMSSMITWYFVSTGRRIDRGEAILLIAIYLLFILQELGFSVFVL